MPSDDLCWVVLEVLWLQLRVSKLLLEDYHVVTILLDYSYEVYLDYLTASAAPISSSVLLLSLALLIRATYPTGVI